MEKFLKIVSLLSLGTKYFNGKFFKSCYRDLRSKIWLQKFFDVVITRALVLETLLEKFFQVSCLKSLEAQHFTGKVFWKSFESSSETNMPEKIVQRILKVSVR